MALFFTTVNVLKNFKHKNNMFVIRARIHKMLVRIANWEDTDQTAYTEAV